ncbi:hypothetical protein KIPB_007357, partial [Kipferlia bialata]
TTTNIAIGKDWLMALRSGEPYLYDRTATDWESTTVTMPSCAGAKSASFDMSLGDHGTLAIGCPYAVRESDSASIGGIMVLALDENRDWQQEQLLQDPDAVVNASLGSFMGMGSGKIASANKGNGATSVLVWDRNSGDPSAPWSPTVRTATSQFSEAWKYGSTVAVTSTSLLVASQEVSLLENGVPADPVVSNVGGVYHYSVPPLVTVEAVLPTLTLSTTCGTQTLVFTLIDDGVTLTENKTAVLTMGWGVADDTLTPTWSSSGNSYSVDITGPSVTGDNTFTVWYDGTVVGTTTATLAQALNIDNTAVSWSLPEHALIGSDGDASGDFSFGMTPKDDCDVTMTDKTVSFAYCDANDQNCSVTSTFGTSDGFSVTEHISTEGVWTVSASVDGTEMHSDSIVIAPVFATVGSAAIGVSATLSTLTGLPTTTEEAYTAVLTLKDVAGHIITSDVAPVLEWDGTVTALTWDATAHTYSLTGTEWYTPVTAVPVTVSVGGVTVVSENVSTVYDITCTDLTLPIEGTCQQAVGTFSLLKAGLDYTIDRTAILTATWEDSASVPVVYSAGSYTLALQLMTPGVHTLIVKLDGTSIASQSVTLSSRIDGSRTSISTNPTRGITGEDVTVTVYPRDYCNVDMAGPLSLNIALSLGGTVAVSEAVTANDSFAMATSLSDEGVYTIAVLDGTTEVMNEPLEVAPIYAEIDGGMGRLAVSGLHSTLTGLPTSANADYTATLVLKNLDGTVIERDLSIDSVVSVTYAGVPATVVWDATANHYRVTGNSGATTGTVPMVAHVDTVAVVTETTSIRNRRAVVVAVAAVAVVGAAVGTTAVVRQRRSRRSTFVEASPGASVSADAPILNAVEAVPLNSQEP